MPNNTTLPFNNITMPLSLGNEVPAFMVNNATGMPLSNATQPDGLYYLPSSPETKLVNNSTKSIATGRNDFNPVLFAGVITGKVFVITAAALIAFIVSLCRGVPNRRKNVLRCPENKGTCRQKIKSDGPIYQTVAINDAIEAGEDSPRESVCHLIESISTTQLDADRGTSSKRFNDSEHNVDTQELTRRNSLRTTLRKELEGLAEGTAKELHTPSNDSIAVKAYPNYPDEGLCTRYEDTAKNIHTARFIESLNQIDTMPQSNISLHKVSVMQFLTKSNRSPEVIDV